MRILGIDPGTEKCGYGIIEDEKTLAYDTIIAKGRKVDDRLPQIMRGVEAVIIKYRPDVVAIEKHFQGKYPVAAMALGEVRGVIKSLCMRHGIKYYDYEPAKVKKAVLKGNAKKMEVAWIVSEILNIPAITKQDAADALAVALCHQHTQQTMTRMQALQKP